MACFRAAMMVIVFALCAVSDAGLARTLTVGPGKMFAKPSDAAMAAQKGDVVLIDAGPYERDVAIWQASDLTIKGVGGYARLLSMGRTAGKKAIWIVAGNNTTIENIEFSGAVVPDHNGAGIRLEGTGLTVRNCLFRENEMGILTGPDPRGHVLVEHSEFFANTVDYERHREPGHNIYIGRQKRFTVRYSHFHGAVVGHNIKSRAATNIIAYNRIEDGEKGSSSYLVDLPNGGRSVLVGNIFHQGGSSASIIAVSFGTVSGHPSQNLFVVNNTFLNDRIDGVFIRRTSAGRTVVLNNIFKGPGTILEGHGIVRNNLLVDGGSILTRMREFVMRKTVAPVSLFPDGTNIEAERAGFIEAEKLDVRLRADSPARDRGNPPGFGQGLPLVPTEEYRHPRGKADRFIDRKLDIGAYEFRPAASPPEPR